MPLRTVPEVLTADRAGRRRPRARADRELDRGHGDGHPRHAGLRHRPAHPAGGRPAGLAAISAGGRGPPRRRPRRRVASEPVRAVPVVARPQAGRRRPSRSRTPPPKAAEQVARVGEPPTGVDRQRATPPSATDSRCSPPRSRTTPETRPASCSSAAGARTDGTRQDLHRVLPARGPARVAARHPSGVRRAGRSTSRSWSPGPTKRGPRPVLLLHRLRGPCRRRAVADCLRNLAAKQAEVKFLGSYPVAGEARARRDAEAASDAWRPPSDLGRRPCAPRSARPVAR